MDCPGRDSGITLNAKTSRRASRREDKRVKRNKGAPGIDGMTVGDFPDFAREHWERIASQLRKGIYHPAPVRRVFIILPAGRSAVSLRI